MIGKSDNSRSHDPFRADAPMGTRREAAGRLPFDDQDSQDLAVVEAAAREAQAPQRNSQKEPRPGSAPFLGGSQPSSSNVNAA